RFCAACALAFGGAAFAAKPQVFVVGTLYKKHETVAAYDLAALSRIVEAIAPDVVVLDVNPTELAERKVFPGKVEYTRVLFPYVEKRGVKAYAGEPAEPTFTDIVNAVIRVREDLKARDPAGAAAMEAYRRATYDALVALWKEAADVHDDASEAVVMGLKRYEEAMLGAVEADSDRRWDTHAANVALQAVKENPGKRVLQVAGIENLPLIRATLRDSGQVEVVDMAAWIRANAAR
ncbi:MAG TPA: hypothetical protein VJ724_06290, partial [Tahibacter sp.]|nr:hypothetical protein [Tahibacter sp.]